MSIMKDKIQFMNGIGQVALEQEKQAEEYKLLQEAAKQFDMTPEVLLGIRDRAAKHFASMDPTDQALQRYYGRFMK